MKWWRVGVLAVVVAGVGAVVALSLAGGREPAPQVSYTVLDGSRHDSAALRGKVVLVNFWATSCTTCMHEMPRIIETHNKFKARGFETIGVAMSYDPPAYVINYAQTRKLPFAVAIDNTGEIAKRFGNVQLTPTTFVIDKQGRIVKRYVGEPDFTQLHALLDKLLAET
ncbi:MAG: TlpA disulfide reductase family protein [Burkholderiales bacterium]